MDDYQEEKDNPRKQVVDMEMDELSVTAPFLAWFYCYTRSLSPVFASGSSL